MPYIVLAALDLNPGSSLVFERAAWLASVMVDGELHVVNVGEPEVPLLIHPGLLPAPALETGNDNEVVTEFCRDRLKAFHEAYPHARLPHVYVHSAIGLAADEIIWLAAHLDADQIVLATHGRSGIKRFLMGSVAEKVMRLAGCPVTVVRDKHHGGEWKVPEIEPLCPDCGKTRQETRGGKLWCARHSEHHVRPHGVVSYTGSGESAPSAWSSSTGT